MRGLFSRRSGFWLLLLVSLAFNAGFGTTFGVRTYRHCRGAGQGDGPSCRTLHETLNLTEDQTAQMRAAKDKLCRQVDALRSELTAERETLAEQLALPEPDQAAVAAQLDKITAIQKRIQQRVVEHLLEEKALLTPEQREAFNAIIRRRLCPGHGAEGIPVGCGLREGSGPPRSGPCAGMDRP